MQKAQLNPEKAEKEGPKGDKEKMEWTENKSCKYGW